MVLKLYQIEVYISWAVRVVQRSDFSTYPYHGYGTRTEAFTSRTQATVGTIGQGSSYIGTNGSS